ATGPATPTSPTAPPSRPVAPGSADPHEIAADPRPVPRPSHTAPPPTCSDISDRLSQDSAGSAAAAPARAPALDSRPAPAFPAPCCRETAADPTDTRRGSRP